MKLRFTKNKLARELNPATCLMILVLLPVLVPVLAYMVMTVGINSFQSNEN